MSDAVDLSLDGLAVTDDRIGKGYCKPETFGDLFLDKVLLKLSRQFKGHTFFQSDIQLREFLVQYGDLPVQFAVIEI